MDVRRRIAFMCLVSGLLLLCLAFLEFPEMSSLHDDTSNDFTFLTTDSGRLPVIAEFRVTSGKQESRTPVRILPDWRYVSRFTSADPSQDFLTLYSLWRT
jgi:hypothetical protein